MAILNPFEMELYKCNFFLSSVLIYFELILNPFEVCTQSL
jgi:hypothetical protein